MINTGNFQINSKVGQYEKLSSVEDDKIVSNDGWTFNCDRYLLAKHSIFFRDVFYLCPDDKIPLIIPNVRGAILEQVLCFINTEHVQINQENFTELIMAADYLQIHELSSQLKTLFELQLSVDNCLKIFIASVKISDKRLYDLSYRIIQTNFQSLLHKYKAGLTDIPAMYLKSFLSDNSLCIAGEHVIWDFIVQWMSIDTCNRLNEACGFLKCLKGEEVDESLAKEIIHSDIICQNPYFKNIMNTTFEKFPSNLDSLKYILRTCSESPKMSTPDFYNHRLPSCLHLIICDMWFEDGTASRDIYVTYDEKVDIWRKLGEFKCLEVHRRVKLVVAGDSIYSFIRGVNCHVFNLYDKDWCVRKHIKYNDFIDKWPVTIKNNIYFLPWKFYDYSAKLEFYDTKTGLLSDTAPMHPMRFLSATSVQDKLIVVGNDELNLRTLAQVYEEASNSWSIIAEANIYRKYFSLTAYHDKIYISKGIGDDGVEIDAVEVFDTERNEWKIIDDLPFDATDPLFMINRRDPDEENVQYILSENSAAWELPSVQNFKVCLVHTLKDRKLIKALVKESRHPNIRFKKSLFH